MPMDPDLQEIARNLRQLHLQLEAEGQTNSRDWRFARELEDRFGAQQNLTTEHHVAAAMLLEKYAPAPEHKVEYFYGKIVEARELGVDRFKASSTERIMVALALADRGFLDRNRNEDVQVLAHQLDSSQRAALERFRRSNRT